MAASSSKKKKNKGKKKEVQQEPEGDFDERFIAAVNRPQFQNKKDEKNKVVLDERFASVLTDPKFSLQSKDKYGRKKKGKKNAAESELSEFYTVEKPEDSDQDDDEEEEDNVEKKESDDDSDEEEKDDDDKDPASRIAYLTALSRGELDVSESSENESDSESSDDDSADSGDNAEQGKAGILDPSSKNDEEISITDVPSPYMAVMNMDWTHVRAVDLFSMIASFTAPGSVRKVQIYPSDYGLERMDQERHEGPTGLWKKTNAQVESDEEEEDVGSVEEEEEEKPSKPQLKFELEDEVDSGFDQEKLRAYEASKLKYYFAIVEFASSEHADVAYKEVDGLELEHSSASVDMRSIDPDQLGGVVDGRKLRDEATSVPSNYEPPEFVVNALQQTNVECTWDEGDAERTRKLTQYSSGQGWQDLADSGDLRAYLASDHSSDDNSDAESDDGAGKGNKMRMLLGLEGDDDDDLDMEEKNADSEEEESDEDGGFGGESGEKQFTFVPGKNSLKEKIRNKMESKGEKELTPWEKYQEKRKQRRREKRQASRKGGKPAEDESDEDEQDEAHFQGDDDFFVDEERESMKKENKSMKKAQKKNKKTAVVDTSNGDRAPSTKAELSLLVAGEVDEEDAKDYDMRGLIRMDNLKGKKLKGARKRKQDKLAANVSGGDFRINTQDSRFAAVLKGADDRFGIDRTDPSFKDTPAMRDILSEQTKERTQRKKAKKNPVAPNINAEAAASTSTGAMALSSLVQSLKSKVAKNAKA
jgi:hypothetical protein